MLKDTTKVPKVVLVEDNPADAEIVLLLVAQWNSPVEVVPLETGEKLLDYFADPANIRNTQLILMDLNLPGIPGMDLISQLKGNPAWRNLPLVVFTSSNYKPEIEEAYRRGANGYVCKPLDLADLENLLKGILHFWTEVNVLAS